MRDIGLPKPKFERRKIASLSQRKQELKEKVQLLVTDWHSYTEFNKELTGIKQQKRNVLNTSRITEDEGSPSRIESIDNHLRKNAEIV